MLQQENNFNKAHIRANSSTASTFNNNFPNFQNHQALNSNNQNNNDIFIQSGLHTGERLSTSNSGYGGPERNEFTHLRSSKPILSINNGFNNAQPSISTNNSERKHKIVFQPTDMNEKIYKEQQADEKEIAR